MEGTINVDVTLDLYRRALQAYPNWVYACKLISTEQRMTWRNFFRCSRLFALVKGPTTSRQNIAFPRKQDVDENYFVLGKEMLRAKRENRCGRGRFGTHDVALIRRLSEFASTEGFRRADFEVQMLYGIQRVEQERLADEGCTSMVACRLRQLLVSVVRAATGGTPTNLWFMVRNVFAA